MMILKDMKRTTKNGTGRYLAILSDDLGAADYELSIHGPEKLVEQTFEKSDFEIVIRPKATKKEAEAYCGEAWGRYHATAKAPEHAAGLEVLEKRNLEEAESANSVVITTRRVRGEGTFWALWFPNLFVGTGSNLFFTMPSVCNCSATLFPITGDPDLFLTLNGTAGPAVASSRRAGTAIDSVSFGSTLCWPWTEFWPFFRVNGFRTSVTGFWMTGFGVFP
jgi:hypothetical protein